MQLFYSPEIVNDVNTLNNNESNHCISVLRKNVGDTIFLIDGIGFFYKATILNISKKNVIFRVIDKWPSTPRSYKLHIAISPLKSNSRFEWFLEKAVEIGIDEITPIICDYSQRKLLKTSRMYKVLLAASKQSLQAKLPTINPLVKLKDFLKLNHTNNCLIAHFTKELKINLTSLASLNSLILIGPEGGFSDNEINQAIKNKFKPVSLGNSRFRSETAGIIACHTLSLKYENI